MSTENAMQASNDMCMRVSVAIWRVVRWVYVGTKSLTASRRPFKPVLKKGFSCNHRAYSQEFGGGKSLEDRGQWDECLRRAPGERSGGTLGESEVPISWGMDVDRTRDLCLRVRLKHGMISSLLRQIFHRACCHCLYYCLTNRSAEFTLTSANIWYR